MAQGSKGAAVPGGAAASAGALPLWKEKKGRPRKAVLTPRDKPAPGDDDDDIDSVDVRARGCTCRQALLVGECSPFSAPAQSKPKPDQTDKLVQAAFSRQAEMRLLCLMHQGRGDWETVQDKDSGTVLYRNNVTKQLYRVPPKESDKFGDLLSLQRCGAARARAHVCVYVRVQRVPAVCALCACE